MRVYLYTRVNTTYTACGIRPCTHTANLISYDQEIANQFNNYFTDIGQQLANTIDSENKYPFQHYLRTPCGTNLQFSNINSTDVLHIINELKPKNSAGHDLISCKLLKEIRFIISEPLAMVINQTLLTGIFPNKLKIAKVIPLFKKGDKSIIENYRPISILPSISKVFEKIIFNQLYDHFQKHNLFFNGQYGFRRNHSTELATLDLIEKIQYQLDTHKNPFAIFLDLSKAFDTIDHDILLTKLYYYGIRNQVLCLFKNYLSSRSQYISMGEIKSSLRNINTGVPQGSILGPLLFLIYINDIHTVSNKFDYILYADDTTLVSNTSTFKSHNNQLTISENISIELLKISDWIAVNKLSLNAKKSKYILVSCCVYYVLLQQMLRMLTVHFIANNF